MKPSLLVVLVGAFFCCSAFAQKPVPGPNDVVVEPSQETEYFAGATDDDKAFVDAVLKGLEASDLSRLQQWRIKRLLKRPSFVRQAKSECAQDIYWDNPEAFNGLIDWENLDIEKLKELVNVIMQLIEFISKLFAYVEPEQTFGMSEVEFVETIKDKYHAESEVRLWDGTRVDLLSDSHAIEVDYAVKWGEHWPVAVLRGSDWQEAGNCVDCFLAS